jgi:hypothetical protein
MNNLLRIFLSSFILSSIALSQQGLTQKESDSLPRAKVHRGYKAFSLTYADSLNTSPDTTYVAGIIEGITSVPAPCGVMCWWGTALIHLEPRPVGYAHDSMYVAVRCLLAKESEFVGKKINSTVTRLFKSDITQGCSAVFNRFDSHSIPFYKFTKEDALRSSIK